MLTHSIAIIASEAWSSRSSVFPEGVEEFVLPVACFGCCEAFSEFIMLAHDQNILPGARLLQTSQKKLLQESLGA